MPQMTRAQRAKFAEVMTPLIVAYGLELDDADVLLWAEKLRRYPLKVIEAAEAALIDAALEFPPRLPDVLRACNEQKAKLTEPYEPCSLCDHTGWREVEINGVSRARRCACHQQWRQRQVSAGLIEAPPLALTRSSR